MTLLCLESRPVNQQSSMLTVKPLFLHINYIKKAKYLTVTSWYCFKFTSTTHSNCLFDVIKWEDRPMHVNLYGII